MEHGPSVHGVRAEEAINKIQPQQSEYINEEIIYTIISRIHVLMWVDKT